MQAPFSVWVVADWRSVCGWLSGMVSGVERAPARRLLEGDIDAPVPGDE
jgi:hypothetical protein